MLRNIKYVLSPLITFLKSVINFKGLNSKGDKYHWKLASTRFCAY